MPPVTFTETRDGVEVHEYTYEGKKIPSVSVILSSCGFVNYNGVRREVMEAAREFGTDVHVACHYFDENDLDIESLDERVRLRLNGWIKFRKDFDFKPEFVEEPVAHQINGMWFGMKPDRFGTSNLGRIVVEIKNMEDKKPSHAIQTAAYADYFTTPGQPAPKRIGVYLIDNGYKLEEFTDRKDVQIFNCILAATWWKINQGVLKI